MKKIICLLLILPLLGGGRAHALETLRGGDIPIDAPSAILMERETGTVLYEKDADRRMAPASVTKVMTMLLIVEALDEGRLKPEEIVTASKRAASFGGSCVYLEEGEKMSVDEMLKCIAVVSANDCAVAMAEHLCGTEARFEQRMNERAGELGMVNTNFTNCTGLFDDDAHYTTARDIALMSCRLLAHERIKAYSTIWTDSIRGGDFELANTNRLLQTLDGCTGLKTGFTNTAMYCLAASAERDGVEYVAVVLHEQSSEKRNADAAALLNYAFANYRLCPLIPAEALPELTVDLGRQARLPLRLAGPACAVTERSSPEPEYRLVLPEGVAAPVSEGEELGKLLVTLDGELLAEIPVAAAESVERLGYFGLLLRLAGSMVGL